MKTHSTLILVAIVNLAACVNSAPVTFTSETAYLNAIGLLEVPIVFEGFEDDTVWGGIRSTIVGGTHTAPSVFSNGITWTSNNTVSQVTTGPGAARTGNWGFFTLPHGDYAHGIGDGFRVSASTPLVAAGGWVETNTPFAELNLVLDGTVILDFGDPTIGTQPLFFGVVEPDGFQLVEFREIEGTLDEQKFIFADDFTIAGPQLTGDYNGDGSVDAADYIIWRKTDGAQTGYDTWRAHFGRTAGSGAVVAANLSGRANSSIPEPASVVLCVLGVTWILIYRLAGPTSKERRLKIAGCVALTLLGLLHARAAYADTFGSGVNTFSIGFVTVGDPGNSDDSGTTGSWWSPFGGVGYTFRMGTYEISRDMIIKANAEGNLGITMFSYAAAGINGGDRAARPASEVTWNEAARFVNWLNVNRGHSQAYKFTLQPGDPGYSPDANIELWQAGDAGYDPNNLYRNTGAYYFLPSEDEWYKAAYYSGSGSTYFDYATQQDFPAAPSGTSGGTASGTAVFQQNYFTGPADIDYAGGLSHYGAMAQNGNVWEWMESASDGLNNTATEARTIRGAHWSQSVEYLRSNARLDAVGPTWQDDEWGFRVASQCLCPTFESQPQSQTASVGSDVTFFVDATGTEPISYQWRKDNFPVSGAIDPSFSILDVVPSDAGVYDVWSSNLCGAALSDTATLTVIDGDYNHDGFVDAADYVIWREYDGTQIGYDTWRAHFGQHSGSGAGTWTFGSTPSVPEPAAASLVLAAIGLALRRPSVLKQQRR